MSAPVIALVVARGRNGVIGRDGDLPWRLRSDLQRFKAITVGKPCLMGRKTWESLNPKFRPLPGRENYVLSSRTPGQWSAGAQVLTAMPSLSDAWVIGGGQIYTATLDQVDRIEVTLMGVNIGSTYGDKSIYAPDIPEEFGLAHSTDWLTSDKGHLELPEQSASDLPFKYRFLTYDRKDAA